MNMYTNDSPKKYSPLMGFILSAGNFLFVLGIIFAMNSYDETHNRKHAGQFAKTWGFDFIYSYFPSLAPTELLISICSGVFALAAVCYQASVLILIFSGKKR